jgi:hypothetical protein
VGCPSTLTPTVEFLSLGHIVLASKYLKGVELEIYLVVRVKDVRVHHTFDKKVVMKHYVYLRSWLESGYMNVY